MHGGSEECGRDLIDTALPWCYHIYIEKILHTYIGS